MTGSGQKAERQGPGQDDGQLFFLVHHQTVGFLAPGNGTAQKQGRLIEKFIERRRLKGQCFLSGAELDLAMGIVITDVVGLAQIGQPDGQMIRVHGAIVEKGSEERMGFRQFDPKTLFLIWNVRQKKAKNLPFSGRNLQTEKIENQRQRRLFFAFCFLFFDPAHKASGFGINVFLNGRWVFKGIGFHFRWRQAYADLLAIDFHLTESKQLFKLIP